MSFYTKRGGSIRHPEAYAKTGAPMYKTKYEEGGYNINQETSIYQLNLEDGKKYVGKTTNYDRRMREHYGGRGSEVTKKFKPIDGDLIDTCPGYFSDKLEQKHTDRAIREYGYDKVRGGKYVNSKTLHKERDYYPIARGIGNYTNTIPLHKETDYSSSAIAVAACVVIAGICAVVATKSTESYSNSEDGSEDNLKIHDFDTCDWIDGCDQCIRSNNTKTSIFNWDFWF